MSKSATGKKYARLHGVTISTDQIPPELHPVIDDAKNWAIIGDSALERAVTEASISELEGVVERAQYIDAEIWAFAHESNGAASTPIPDEVVLFQIYNNALNSLKVELRIRNTKKK